MATLLELGLFQHFSSVFVFLFIFLISFGFLQVSGIFKKIDGHKGIYALLSLALAFLFTISKDAVAVVSVMTPWFTVIIIFLFLIFFVVKMFSGDDDDLFKKLIKNSSVYWILIVVFIIIFIVSLSSIFGQRLLEDQVGPQDLNQSPEITGATYENLPGDVQPGDAGSTASGDFSNNFLLTIVHPKVLGMLLLMLIGFFAILLLAKTPEIPK